MAAPLADGADVILRARLKGKRPADMVIVAQKGPVSTDNPVVRAKAMAKYDWRWVRDLDICVYIDPVVDWFIQLKEIAMQKPGYLCLWNPVEKRGAEVYLSATLEDITKPRQFWVYELGFILWQAFQNDDFITGRTYGRNEQGVPYAIDS